MQILSQENIIKEKTCATIGFFDGVHLGHRFLLEKLKKTAVSSNFCSLVVTFKNHPQSFLGTLNEVGARHALPLLSTENEKLDLISEINPDFCLLLDFNNEISSMKAADFLLFLKNNYSVEKLIIGYDHRFGADKISDFEQYKIIGETLGIEVEQCEPLYLPDNQGVSSSKIRKLLIDGNVETAKDLLGREYSISGIVKSGEKIGRTIGFPTANLSVDFQKQIPKAGVYSVEVEIKSGVFIGMLYIGNRPTLDGKNLTIEVNIFDFSEDIYNQKISLKLKHFIREDKKFNSLQELKNHLVKDKKKVLEFLAHR
ncbi:MAG: bifunctional riboflavin kinase/FAD synthetase [Prevotellaceae bacterium]|nr:bifunctional riboflavin kinase/FAD synthetase [Prevotellaceae bacterium]